MSTTLEPMKTIIVPGWIQRALILNKLNTIDILDYAKVRKVLSLDDMAEWFFMNDRFQIDNCNLSNTVIDSVLHSFSLEAKQEVSNSVLPLSGSEEIANSANSKLAVKTDSHGNPVGNNTYQFIRIDNILYVVLHEGFMTTLQDQESKLEFVKKYLKECYAMASVADVSKHSLFKLYLKHFAI